jgi:hypothetical protein
MKKAIFYALYLPCVAKEYTVDDFFSSLKVFNKSDIDIYVGIQYNSIIRTESILDEYKKQGFNIFYKWVNTRIAIDSDASSFITALKLYKETTSQEYKYCYFVHNKGVTSDADSTRNILFNALFPINYDQILTGNIGSYGPYFTINNTKVDTEKMNCLKRFSTSLHYKAMHYFYVFTFFVMKGNLLKQFIDTCSDDFYTTDINSYSDRYLFERDFCHIVDMQGYVPCYSNVVGNYSNNYIPPSDATIQHTFEEYQSQFKLTA